MSLKRLLPVLLALGLFLGALRPVCAAQWRPAGNSEFDSAGITHLSPSVIRVWGKTVYDEAVLKDLQGKNPGRDYSAYSHTVQLSQVYCEQGTIGKVSSTDYNARGEGIATERFETDAFEDYGIKMEKPAPGSQSEAFVRVVCDHVRRTSAAEIK